MISAGPLVLREDGAWPLAVFIIFLPWRKASFMLPNRSGNSKFAAEVVALLLAANADPGRKDKAGRTALEIAEAEGSKKVAVRLRAGGS